MLLLASRLLRSVVASLPPPKSAVLPPASASAPGPFFFRSSLSSSSSSSSPTLILSIGDAIKLKRSFSVADVEVYSSVSGDSNPLHSDADFARSVGFDAPIVHGILVASLFPALIASHFPGAIYISQTLHFKLPVYTGEELSAEVQALELNRNRNRFIAKFQTKCVKKGEQLVLDGEARAILPSLSYRE